jgi:hypothetical protein
VRRHHRGTGVSSAEQRVRLAVAHRLRRDANRGARLAAQRRGGGFRHLDPLRRVDDVDVEAARGRMPCEFGFDDRRRAGEQHADLQVPRRDQGPVDDDGGPEIAAHDVDGDTHASGERPFQIRSDPELATGA